MHRWTEHTDAGRAEPGTPGCRTAVAEELFPDEMVLTPVSRQPIRLCDATVATVLERPVPSFGALRPIRPEVSVVVVTFNNLVFTRMALESLLDATRDISCEILVVDNASSDGTLDYLAELAGRNANVRLLMNDGNRGFAAANNQGLQQAAGEVLVLLNNDTIVPRGALGRLVGQARRTETGLTGATTNRIGNEAEIETSYGTYRELTEFAAARMERHGGECFDIRTAAMFCTALRRDTFQQIGPLDEGFGLGMFEDDDYAVRVRAAGLRVVCAEDVFVHHFGQASFGNLAASGEYGPLFHRNRRRWEAKWGRTWEPHARRRSESYERLVKRVCAVAEAVVPQGAVTLVASHGDDELLRIAGRHARHFPPSAEGGYAGHHPSDSAAAIADLERLRAAGAEAFVLPRHLQWWLNHYPELSAYLHSCWTPRTEDSEACQVFLLNRIGCDD